MQDNYIKTLEPFNDKEVKFEELIYLRVDNNKFNEKDDKKDNKKDDKNDDKKDDKKDNKKNYKKDKELIKAIKKFGKKLIYETLDTASFCKKYNINFDPNDEKLDLCDQKKKELLTDLFLFIGFQFNIKY